MCCQLSIASIIQHCIYLILIIKTVNTELWAYKTYSLEEPDLCHSLTRKKAKLGGSNPSAIIIQQKRLNYHPIDCHTDSFFRFEITTAEKETGIFAVIQHLVLRKNESTDECIDYVQFKRLDGSTSRKFCGRFNAALTMDRIFIPEQADMHGVAWLNTFIDLHGALEVYIFLSKDSLRKEAEMDLNLVLTSYRECANAPRYYKACIDNFSCISEDYFDDGIINCPYLNCVDENGCAFEDKDDIKRKPLGNKVLIGYVTSLVLMFGLFIVCVYICRKFGALCWSDSCINSRTPPTPRDRVIELNQPSTRSTSATTTTTITAATTAQDVSGAPAGTEAPSNSSSPASAPPLEPSNKDLPPSYDSLFPVR